MNSYRLLSWWTKTEPSGLSGQDAALPQLDGIPSLVAAHARIESGRRVLPKRG